MSPKTRQLTAKERERRRKLILETYKETGSIKATRRKLGYAIKTIRKVLRGQDEPRLIAQPAQRTSKLDPYKPHIKRLVIDDKLTATLVHDEITALGFDGSYSIVKNFVRKIRPRPKVKATCVIEHPPGAEGQVDWSPYRVFFRTVQVIVHGFSMVLPFSSYSVLRFALDEKCDTLIELHDEAFTEIGAIPPLMTYDNMTTVGRHVAKDKIQLNPRFEAYASECGFEIRLIDPGQPNQHASVERMFHYVENNCLLRRRSRFEDLDDLNRHAKWWCDEVANVRIHGTTRERPTDRLARELPFMKPLVSVRPERVRLLSRSVRSNFCVRVDTNLYSVPPSCVGREATVRVFSDRLDILVEGSVVAVHPICHGRHQRMVLPEHEAQFKRCTTSRLLLEQAFLRLGPAASDYYDGLRVHKGRGAGYHLKRILSLADRHGSSVVTGAMAHAASFGNYSAEAVVRVIAGKTLRDHTTACDDVPMPPERVRRWLEGLEVEGRDLEDYDHMVDRLDNDDDEQEGDDGQA